MKTNKETILSFGFAMLLFTAAYGQNDLVERDTVNNAIHNRVVGLWDVQVTVRHCVTEAPLATFKALHKYELGGTGEVVPATNPAGLSDHLAVWNFVGRDQYNMSFKMFRFDASGINIGWAVVRNSVNITDGLYTGSGVAEFYDNSGNMVGISCPSFEGIRFE